MKLDRAALEKIVANALAEDLDAGDVTSSALIPPDAEIKAVMVSRDKGVLAGLPVAQEVFQQTSEMVAFRPLLTDGDALAAGSRIAEITGPACAVLAGERVALNFMQRLCGIATLTRKCVEAVNGYDCRILDTRKTTPGLRILEKYAVLVGGGCNHRMGLYDQVLIKDNHLRVLLPQVEDIYSAVELAVQRARARAGNMLVEVEAEDFGMVEAALRAGADIIMLDNMSEDEMRSATKAVRARRAQSGCNYPLTEASGRLTLARLAAVAATGVDTISLGALTHSAPVLDLGMDAE